MEPYRHGGAASSNPAAELEAHLHAMRLGDPSSSASHLQPHHRAAIPPLLLNPQQQQVLARAPPPPHMFQYPPQALLPTATPDMRLLPPPHMFQHPPQALLPTATLDMRLLPHPHPQARSYFGGGEGFFPGDGYVSPVGASFPFGVNHPSFNFNVPAAPRPSNLSVSAEEYHPGSSRSASALTRVEVLSLLVQGQMVQALVMSAESSPHVVQLLAEGDARVRQGVLAGIRSVVHNVMKHSVGGHDVFLELLRACNGKPDDLKVLIDNVCNGKGKLMAAFHENLGRIALEELIRMMASNRPLCERLIRGLFEKERLLQASSGHVVLRHCFATLPYEECSFIIKHALETIDVVLFSPFGWSSLAVCFENAKGDDLKKLEELVFTLTSEIAKGKWSTYLLQNLLVSGSEDLKVRISHRVAADILDLAMDEDGCYVVQACILASTETLRCVLDAVQSLHRRGLEALVLGWCSTYVVRNLLLMGKNFLPELTKNLAFRIEGMPVDVRRQKEAELVLQLIHELFPFS
ncbi:unnamed protein product [Urochloa humidicola]